MPYSNIMMSSSTHSALTRSVRIMMICLSWRSANTPPRGPSTACGSSMAIPAVASAAALPVLSVIHHNRTNWVIADPTRESACPRKIDQNLRRQASSDMPASSPWTIPSPKLLSGTSVISRSALFRITTCPGRCTINHRRPEHFLSCHAPPNRDQQTQLAH